MHRLVRACGKTEISCRELFQFGYDLQTGKRGNRTGYAEELLCQITGAEAAIVVNNNAGAVLLALSALTKGGEVIVSRGELVEMEGNSVFRKFLN